MVNLDLLLQKSVFSCLDVSHAETLEVVQLKTLRSHQDFFNINQSQTSEMLILVQSVNGQGADITV